MDALPIALYSCAPILELVLDIIAACTHSSSTCKVNCSPNDGVVCCLEVCKAIISTYRDASNGKNSISMTSDVSCLSSRIKIFEYIILYSIAVLILFYACVYIVYIDCQVVILDFIQRELQSHKALIFNLYIMVADSIHNDGEILRDIIASSSDTVIDTLITYIPSYLSDNDPKVKVSIRIVLFINARLTC